MFLGLDIGTSGVKAVILDQSGNLVAQSLAPLQIQRPHPLWSEQDPRDWWSAANKAVSNLDTDARRQVRSIGLSGQMHGATILNNEGQPIRPAILWNDGRSLEQCAAMEALIPELGNISGNRAMPGFTAPKLLWLKEHEPQAFERIAHVLLPKDYVRLRMTGDYASDMSDSSGTLWLDVAKRDWSLELLAVTGLSREHMPQLYEGSEITGLLRPELAEAWGMNRVPVVAGGGDNAAGAVGVGAINEGDAFLSLGTSGVIFAANAGYRPYPAGGVHCFCHAISDRWHQMSVTLSAASCMDWAARLTSKANAAELFKIVENTEVEIGDELFLPYLSGERTPHNDPRAKGVLFGLDHDSNPARIGRAVLEGVAFALRDGLDALAGAGTVVEQLTVIGGGAQSLFWGNILSSALEVPLVYRESGEIGPAYGAARLAQLGIGETDSDDICQAPAIQAMIEPDHKISDQLLRKLPRFRKLYSNLHELFGETT